MSAADRHLPGLARKRGLPMVPGTNAVDLAVVAAREAPNVLIPGKQSYAAMSLEQRLASRRAKVQAPIFADARYQHAELMKQRMMQVDNDLGHDVVLLINDLEWTISMGKTMQPRGIALAFEEYKVKAAIHRQLTSHGSMDHDRNATRRDTGRLRADVEWIANQNPGI